MSIWAIESSLPVIPLEVGRWTSVLLAVFRAYQMAMGHRMGCFSAIIGSFRGCDSILADLQGMHGRMSV